MAKQGRFDILLVWALDRLTREGSLKQILLIHSFADLGVRVVSVQEDFTHVQPEFADVLYAIYGYMANQESLRRSERTKAGLQRTLSIGRTKAGKRIKALGRPPGSKDREPRKKRCTFR